ncbi:acyltransferase [Horticoccus luteus]|uniref:Acyltransferase n=1 Tax=Horticoccus luteus TaxID=2862869 RepID=A0A8F9TVE0_9BACT|nr:acyltransferase [Horticoccus luteus]QYM79785.1 acyltransferase [Horticoccus luteus]
MHYTDEELRALGLQFGDHVSIHRTVEFFRPERIRLGSHVRIDCFSVLSAAEPLVVGSHVHLAAGVMIFGSEGVEIGDFAGLSSRVAVYTASDDYVGGHLTNPTVPEKYRKVSRGKVRIEPHTIVGSGSVILPGVTLGRGASVGALTLVRKDVPACQIVAGNPARVLGQRDAEKLAVLEAEFLREERGK